MTAAVLERARGMRRRNLLAGLAGPAVLLVVAWAVGTSVGPASDVRVNDLYVYRTYAGLLSEGLVPYRDFALEYPPLALAPIWLGAILGLGEDAYAVGFGGVMLAIALVTLALTAALAGEHGRTAAWLLAPFPVLVGAMVRTHFDLLPVALVLAALLALARERRMLAFVLLGLGAMTKGFPGLLVPVFGAWLVAAGHGREALRGTLAFVGVVAAISLPFLGAGYLDAYAFHLERPVQIESTPASVLFALGGSEVTGTTARPDRFKSNGLDGGWAAPVAALFALALAAALAAAVAGAYRRPDARGLLLATLAALLAFMALGKVLSPQFLVWLAPFAALCWVVRERRLALLCLAAILLTHLEFPSRYLDLVREDPAVIALVAARNAILLAALAAALSSLHSPAASRARSPRLAAAPRRR